MSKIERQEQFTRNLKHALDFLDAAIDNPERLDEVPDNADVVFMPADDPELQAVNAELITGSVVVVAPTPGIAATGTVTPPATSPPTTL
jgi:hypothetical protein